MTDPQTLEILEVTDVTLREVFANEPRVFTPWLARPENLARLGRALGMELQDMETEVSTGIFRIDGLARRTDDDSQVVIENQFGRSDHDHLGKTLTYLAAVSEQTAHTVVWISEAFADEHLAVLRWLNDNTPEKVGFYGVIPRVIRIGDSAPALTFEVEVRPNTVVKATRSSARGFDEAVTARRWRYWPHFMEAVAREPALANVILTRGGGLGYMHVHPGEWSRELPWEPAVLAYINAPRDGASRVQLHVRAAHKDMENRLWDVMKAKVERGDLPAGGEEADFDSDEGCAAIARVHAGNLAQWMPAYEALVREEAGLAP